MCKRVLGGASVSRLVYRRSDLSSENYFFYFKNYSGNLSIGPFSMIGIDVSTTIKLSSPPFDRLGRSSFPMLSSNAPLKGKDAIQFICCDSVFVQLHRGVPAVKRLV